MISNDQSLKDLSERLDILIRLMALAIAPEAMPLKDKALRLSKAGMTPKAIAELFDTTPNTVSVALSTAKRKSKSKRKN